MKRKNEITTTKRSLILSDTSARIEQTLKMARYFFDYFQMNAVLCQTVH